MPTCFEVRRSARHLSRVSPGDTVLNGGKMDSSADVGAFVVWVLLWSGIGGLVGALIGSSKGRGAAGFWLGFFLGIIGWIIVAFLSPRQRPGVGMSATAPSMATYQQQLKQWAVGEAIRRDPSLGARSDSATLARLDAAAQQLMREAEVLRMQQQATQRPPTY